MREIEISIVICTQNRAELLDRCLRTVLSQAAGCDDVEIVLVDNRSTDNTRALVESLFSRQTIPCRYIYEDRPGISYARNRGRAESRGKVIAYTDDDALPRPGWLAGIREHFHSKKSDYLGGRVELALETPLPPWFPKGLIWVIGQSQFGEQPRILESECPISANCAIRAEAFDAIGGYDPKISFYGEEVNFFYRLKGKGFVTMYRPDIIVDHFVSASRLTKESLRKKAYLIGRGAAQTAMLPSCSFSDRRKLLAHGLYHLLYVSAAWLTGPRFDREFTLRLYWGYLNQVLSWRS